jgi:hypothetical protein
MKKYLIALALLFALPVWSAELKLFWNYSKIALADKDKVFVEKILQEIDFYEVAMDLMVNNGARSGVINKYLNLCKNNQFGGHVNFTVELMSGKFDPYFRKALTNTNGPSNARDFATVFLSVTDEYERKELLKLSAQKSKFVNKLVVGYYLNDFVVSNNAAFENIGNSFYAEHCGTKSN